MFSKRQLAKSSKKTSSFVWAPIRIVTSSVDFTKVSNRIIGTRPVPPPTSKSFPSLISKEFPYGPRIPICSPTLVLNKPVEAEPCFLTVNAAFPDSFEIIILIGNSFIPGIQTIANCPGRTLDIISSEKTKVLTVGVSSIIFSIVTIVGWL